MRIAVFAIAICAAAAPAMAAEPNDQDCKQFISGTWTSKPGDGGKEISVTYQADGVYRQEGGATPDGSDVETGSWTALETTPAGGCDLTLTPTGGEERTFTLTMVDENTVKVEDGTVSSRTEGTMEQHTSP